MHTSINSYIMSLSTYILIVVIVLLTIGYVAAEMSEQI